MNSAQPAAYARPTPIRSASRLVTAAPSTPPTAAAPSTAPIRPARKCSSRTAYSRYRAENIRLKKLMVATASSEARTIGEPAMNRAPAVTEPFAVLSSADGSAGRMRRKKKADPRNDTASATYGERGREQLHEQPADAGTADKRQRPARIDERIAVKVAVSRNHGYEQCRVSHVEQDAQRARSECHGEQLGQRENAQRVTHAAGSRAE